MSLHFQNYPVLIVVRNFTETVNSHGKTVLICQSSVRMSEPPPPPATKNKLIRYNVTPSSSY